MVTKGGNNMENSHAESTTDKNLALAREIIAGTAPMPSEFSEFKRLVNQLKAMQEFAWARKLLAAGEPVFVAPLEERLLESVKRGHRFGEEETGGEKKALSQATWAVQQLALCTYKDEERPPAVRFASALAILNRIGLWDPDTSNAETLSLGGAVYKRMWEHDGKVDHLDQSLSFYLAAWERDTTDGNRCYGGVNAAFIDDLLAFRLECMANAQGVRRDGDERGNLHQRRAKLIRKQADSLRKAILEEMERRLELDSESRSDYWFSVTLADTHFGLALAGGEDSAHFAKATEWYESARRTLDESRDSERDKEWRLQTAFRQALALARLHGFIPQDARWQPVEKSLAALVGKDVIGQAQQGQYGKVGLALSGGGFRAAFFHLGVMARLAEVDALRGIEVLSTVSGGSVVGAHYYLELQNHLQTMQDGQIEATDYVKIVKRVQEDFLKGVQRNLRVRALASLGANLRMIFNGNYSRTKRMGELYEKEIYCRVKDRKAPDCCRRMADLLVAPAGPNVTGHFHPKYDNWRRLAKVPVLLLNTTSLNSGHNWHFTARWMGESPGLLDGGIDANERYRRLNYDQAPTRELQHFPLGYAVAASSCVPGLFEPMALHGLYPGRTVRLVDGGVHDNQGVQGLLNEGCTRILCSDASGQMGDEKTPGDNIIAVPLRANDILQDRVREAEYQDLSTRLDNHAMDGLFFVHLKKNLENEPIDWIDCDNPTQPPQRSYATTPYGIDKDLQRLLSGIRTDLDSFTEVEAEAYALMLSGYLMTEYELHQLQEKHASQGLPGTWGGYAVKTPRGDWPFLKLESIMRQPHDSSDERRRDLEKQLKASSKLLFKIWELNRALSLIVTVAGLALLIGGAFLLRDNWCEALLPSGLRGITWGQAVIGAAILAISIFAAPVYRLLRPLSSARTTLKVAALAVGGYLLSNLHLLVFDKLYLRRGRLARLLRMPGD